MPKTQNPATSTFDPEIILKSSEYKVLEPNAKLPEEGNARFVLPVIRSL
jgi:hypothetical protein